MTLFKVKINTFNANVMFEKNIFYTFLKLNVQMRHIIYIN